MIYLRQSGNGPNEQLDQNEGDNISSVYDEIAHTSTFHRLKYFYLH